MDNDDLSTLDDADLLEFMAAAAEEPKLARDAFDEFYRRHIDFLYRACHRRFARNGDAFLEDLVSDAFLRAYECAGTYKVPASRDQDSRRRNARAWLARITERLAFDMLAPRRGAKLLLRDDEFWSAVANEATPAEENAPSAQHEMLLTLLDRLTDRERQVLVATADFYEPDGTARRMPIHAVAELERHLDTTSANIRQIRSRAMKKIRDGLRAAGGTRR